MFFDHLLKLTSLKSRLLNGSSFTQLYSQEKLPLHKFRRKGAMLSPLIAGLLAACGGGGIFAGRWAKQHAEGRGGAVHVVQVQFADDNRKLRVTDASDTTYLIDIAYSSGGGGSPRPSI